MIKCPGGYYAGLRLPLTKELAPTLNQSVRSGSQTLPVPLELFLLWDICLYFRFQSF